MVSCLTAVRVCELVTNDLGGSRHVSILALLDRVVARLEQFWTLKWAP